jgi:hypothetical protein
MAQSNIRTELDKAQTEPWLPIESKLVGWSLSLGVVLLILLAIANRIFPASL